MKIGTFPHYCGGRLLVGLSAVGPHMSKDYLSFPCNFADASAYRKVPFGLTGSTLPSLISQHKCEIPERTLNEWRIINCLIENHARPVEFFAEDLKKGEKQIGYHAVKYRFQEKSGSFFGIYSAEQAMSHALVSDKIEDNLYALYWSLMAGGDFKYVNAVTQDRGQPFAREVLDAAGFKAVGTGRKSEYANDCTMWLGDSDNILPILEKHKDRYDFHDLQDNYNDWEEDDFDDDY